jgi:hypothetical protein
MQFSSLLRTPDEISVRSGDQLHVAASAGQKRWTFPGGEITIRHAEGALALALSAPGTPVSAVILRWRRRTEPGVSVRAVLSDRGNRAL